MTDLAKSLIEEFKNRSKNRFLGPYVVIFWLLNWESAANFILFNGTSVERIKLAKSSFVDGSWKMALLWATVYCIFAPMLNVLVIIIQSKFIASEKSELVQLNYSSKFQSALRESENIQKRRQQWVLKAKAQKYLNEIMRLFPIFELILLDDSEFKTNFNQVKAGCILGLAPKQLLEQINDKQLISAYKKFNRIISPDYKWTRSEVHDCILNLYAVTERVRLELVFEGDELKMNNYMTSD